MKRCPECGRDYNDDSLSFCLDDGSELLFGPTMGNESPTALVDAPPSDPFGVPPLGSHSREEGATAILATGPPKGGTASAPEGTPLSTKAFDNRRLVIPSLLVMLAIGGFLVYRYVTPATTGQISSIAVMPFVNDSGNPDVEYLSDGMTETLIASLSRLPNLSVKPRSSVFRYKDKDTDIQTIGRELNVQAILNGRVVQRGDQLTLGLELVDVAKDVVIWSEQYMRTQSDLASLQAEIARDVSSKLKTKLTGAEEQNLTKSYTASSGAYQFYLKGRYYWNKRTAENIRKAMEQFQQAADADPNYALAYAGLADCYVVLGDYTGSLEFDTLPKAQAFAKRALELDGSLVEAHSSLAYSYQLLWKWQDAEREFKRAIEIDPNYATAHHWYTLLLMEMGRFSEGQAEIKRAQELDPLSPIIGFNVAVTHLLLGNINAAVEHSKKLIDLDPNFPRGHQVLGQAYLKQNRYEDAIAEFQRALTLSPNDRQALRDLGYGYAVAQKREPALGVLNDLKANYLKGTAYPTDIAAVYAGLGDKDQAFAWLEKAFETRSGRLGRIGYHSPFESLRGDPRYRDLRQRMGLPE